MFDEKKAEAVKAKIDGGDKSPLPEMSFDQLRVLRNEINAILPTERLENLNLEQELVEQYLNIKGVMAGLLVDQDVPANQQASVANSVVTTLQQLVKLQQDLRREQTFKIMESCLVEALKVLPDAVKEQFYAEYERLAEKEGLVVRESA